MTDEYLDRLHTESIIALDRAKAAYYAERTALKARIAELEALVLSQADRIHKQSELLSKKSEKP